MLINAFLEDSKIGIPDYLINGVGLDIASFFMAIVNIFDESIEFGYIFNNSLTIKKDYLRSKTLLPPDIFSDNLKVLQEHDLIEILPSYIDDYYLIHINMSTVMDIKEEYYKNKTVLHELDREKLYFPLSSASNKYSYTGKILYKYLTEGLYTNFIPEVLIAYCEPIICSCEDKTKEVLAEEKEFWDYLIDNFEIHCQNNNIDESKWGILFYETVSKYCNEKIAKLEKTKNNVNM